LAILFIQSGLDKVIDKKGNLDWLKEHFSKSFLKNYVPLLFFKITIVELIAGFACLAGVFVIILDGTTSIALIGVLFAALALIFLFFGQRMAKDYAGAQSLVSYFILVLLTFIFLCFGW
jgi:hypothetical protein